MLRTTLTVLAVLLSASIAQAEITVDEINGDLYITSVPSSNSQDAAYEATHGFNLEIKELNGQVLLLTKNSVMIDGAYSRLYDFPVDDIIIDFSYSGGAMNQVYVHDLQMFDVSDDLRVEVDGIAHIADCIIAHRSHSFLKVKAEMVWVTGTYVKHDLAVEPSSAVSPIDVNIYSSACGGHMQIESDAAVDVDLYNVHVGDNLMMDLSNRSDSVQIRHLLSVVGSTTIALNGGHDDVDIDITDDKGSSLGRNRLIDGGYGFDNLYQNVNWFSRYNTNSITIR